MILKIIGAAFFLVYALFLLSLYDFRKCFNKRCATFFLLGMVSFASVFVVQVPIQKLLGGSVFFYNLSDTLQAILYAAVAGFVQEFFKALAAFYPEGDSLSGAAAGAGFGFTEVIFVLGPAPYISFTAVLERIFILMFHVSSTTLVMFGKQKGKFLISYILLAFIHTAVDAIPILFQMHYVTLTFTEISVAIISTSLFITSLLLYRRSS